MRFSLVLISLISVVSAAPVALSPRASASAIALGPLNNSQKIKIDCKGNEQCNAIVQDGVVHSADDVKDHLGTQTGILTNAAGKAITDEGLPSVGEPLREDGQTADLTLGGASTPPRARRDGVVTTVAKGAFDQGPGPISAAGKEIDVQGKVVQNDVGPGVGEFAGEADRFFNNIDSSKQYHGDEIVNAAVPSNV